MKILHELSWLWETLGIALVAAAVCVACAALIGKAAKKKLSKRVLAVIGAAAFVGAILAVILLARTPMPLCQDNRDDMILDNMILDNRYLYDILTEGKYPERIPLDKLLTGAK